MRPAVPTTVDRMMRSFRALVRAEFPALTYTGLYEYSVQAVASDRSTVDAVPTDSGIPLPSILKIPMRLSGATSNLLVGSKIIVAFINNDPARVAVISCDPSVVDTTIDCTGTMALGTSATFVNLAGATDFVALAAKVLVELGKIAAALTTVANGGGALTGGNTYTAPLSVAASKVKAQ